MLTYSSDNNVQEVPAYASTSWLTFYDFLNSNIKDRVMANRCITSHTVGESLLHIIYPVADQIVTHVIDKLGYRDLIKDNIDIKTESGRDWSKTIDKDGNANTRTNRVRVKLNPSVNPSTIKWEASGTTKALANGNTLQQNENGSGHAQRLPWATGSHISKRRFSIFHDDHIAVDMSERAVGSSMSMEVTMEFEDEFVANEALSRIFQCFTNGEMINYVDILYDYPIPDTFQYLLKYLYHLKCITPENPNGAFGTDKKFKINDWFRWLRENSNDTISLLVNRNRPEHKELVVNKNHFQALYLIECSQETPSLTDPKGASITFNLTIQYSRANILVMEYPVIVNNNYVDYKYIPLERQIRAAGPETMIMWQNPAVTMLWQQTYTNYWPPKPVVFPFYDPWEVPSDSRASQYGYRSVLQAAFTIDHPEDPEGATYFDFDTDVERALGCKLDKDILAAIAHDKNLVFSNNGLVNISVYADDIPVSNKYLDISDGHTLTIKCRSTKPIYRMVISIKPPDKQQRPFWNRVWVASITTHKEKKG